MFKKSFLLLILTGININISFLFAQTQPDLFQQLIQTFRQLDYETAQKIGIQIAADFKSYTPLELLETHKILGVILYQKGNWQEASAQFEQALSIDRTVRLDSVYVSPKIIQWFDQLKLSYNTRTKAEEIEKSIQYRYLVQPDPRPAATLRSLILPGWGQVYKNDRTKGYALVGASATFILTTLTFHFLQQDAHDQYLNATDEKSIQQKYDRYNLLFKLRNNTALLYGGVWLYSFFDALLTAPKERPIRVSFFMDGSPAIGAQICF